MDVLVIGATGYVGGGAGKALAARGHSVIGTARSPEAHRKLEERGFSVIPADAHDPASLVQAATHADAVIYAVQLTGDNAFGVDRAAIDAILGALAGSGKAFVYTSGCWYYGPTGDQPATEESPANPIELVARRPELEAAALAGAARNVRAIVLRPAIVFGDRSGIPMMFAQSARETGAARYIADGTNRWPVVHVDDLGELYALAAEHAGAGDIFNASDESAFTQREIAEAAAAGAGKQGRTASWPLEQAREAMGAFADALALDQRISSKRARSQLGWSTRAATILDDLRAGA